MLRIVYVISTTSSLFFMFHIIITIYWVLMFHVKQFLVFIIVSILNVSRETFYEDNNSKHNIYYKGCLEGTPALRGYFLEVFSFLSTIQMVLLTSESGKRNSSADKSDPPRR